MHKPKTFIRKSLAIKSALVCLVITQSALAAQGDIPPIKTFHTKSAFSEDSGPHYTAVAAAEEMVRQYCSRVNNGYYSKNCRLLSVNDTDTIIFRLNFQSYFTFTPDEEDSWIGPMEMTLASEITASCEPRYGLFTNPDSPYAQAIENGRLYTPDMICRRTAIPDQRDLGASCNSVGNPINAGTGNKYQVETDIAAVGVSPLTWRRTYNSGGFIIDGDMAANAPFWPVSPVLAQLGSHWRSNYDRRVQISRYYANGAYLPAVSLLRDDGKQVFFRLIDGRYVGDAGTSGQLTVAGDGWQYVSADHSTEDYAQDGTLQRITDRNGISEQLSYSDTGLLMRVTDSAGKQLQLTYDAARRVSSITDPLGGKYRYTYDNADGGNEKANLSSVTYPDNTVRTYLYGETDYVGGFWGLHALTGIVDENAHRFATFQYNWAGRAISTEHAGGADKVVVTYPDTAHPHTVITDALGSARTYHFTRINGISKSTGVAQPGGAGCAAAASAITYNDKGNIASSTDFNGHVTSYVYDDMRDLELSRTEAVGTPASRTISTAWHPVYRVPVTIAGPQKHTTLHYDAHGNLLTLTEQASSDATGAQGLHPALTGAARSWVYTYNTNGQVLTSKAPPHSAVTRYHYDNQSNLSSIADARGRVTTLAAYDAAGRVGLITDANGLQTGITYTPRGNIRAIVSTLGTDVQTLDYRYSAARQLTQVTHPDGSVIDYQYDAAQRLTGVQDSLGNRISYTLDAIGNRTQEQVQDPAGRLANSISRAVDALNRVHSITGVAQ